ncbi:MAG: hypothetical protein HYX97_02425 [Chloroflexi bacterium]|nr:hypothetical protein [Chloroflexota bacterium]
MQITTPWRIFIYNNVRDMVDVLPFTSQLIRSTLVTEGQVFGDERVSFLLGDDPLFRGVVSHELTHMLVHEATEPNIGLVPVWLNEGLAEYGNIEPGPTYDAYLQNAIRNNSLLSIYAMTGRVGTPDAVLLLYGEARSLVAYLVEAHGGPKMAELLRAIKSGTPIDTALQQVYGFDRAGLERRWRQAIGAPLTDTATPAPALAPTVAPVPTLPPLGSQPSPTPRPQPTATAAAPTAQPDATVAPKGGGGCNALPNGEADLSLGAALGFVLLGAGLRLRRRR